jgi:glycerol-3-phosphate cytidylyltransferase-like family protein
MTDKEIVDEIERIRASNNTRWMDLVRLAFELDAERAREIFRDIIAYDKQITALSDKLATEPGQR